MSITFHLRAAVFRNRFLLYRVTKIRLKITVFRESYKTFQFFTFRDQNYSINTTKIAILILHNGYLMKEGDDGGRKGRMYSELGAGERAENEQKWRDTKDRQTNEETGRNSERHRAWAGSSGNK